MLLGSTVLSYIEEMPSTTPRLPVIVGCEEDPYLMQWQLRHPSPDGPGLAVSGCGVRQRSAAGIKGLMSGTYDYYSSCQFI